MDPDDVAELKPFAPNAHVEYRPPDAAMICTLLPAETKAKELPPIRDVEDSIKSLFAVAAAPHQEDQTFRIDVVRIDCQELRLCLVAYSYPSFQNSKVPDIIVSFSVIPVPHLSTTHQAYSSLVEEVEELVTMYNSTPLLAPARASSQKGKRPLKRLRRRNFRGDLSISFTQSFTQSVTEQLKQVTRECKPPSRSRRLCDQLGITIGVIQITSFEADGKGGFTIEQKSRLHADRPGAKVTGGAVMGLQPNVNFTVEKNLPDMTYVRIDGGEHLKLVFSKMKYSRKLRWWFFSMLLNETIWVSNESIADAFLPSAVKRREADGLFLGGEFPASFFDMVGGTVMGIGDEVFFKAHSEARTAKRVEKVEKGGSLRISNMEIRLTSASGPVTYWDLSGLEMGLNLEAS